jgi:hypothetical protein
LSTIFRSHQILRDPEESKVVPKASWNTLTIRKAEPTGETLPTLFVPILGIARIAGSEKPRANSREKRPEGLEQGDQGREPKQAALLH